MIRCLFIALISLISFHASAQAEEELIKKVKAKLEKVNDYKANGKMKIDVSFINAPVSQVNVFYKRPNRFKVKKAGGISILPKGGVSINVNSLLFADNYKTVSAGDKLIRGVNTKAVMILPLDESSDIVLMTLYIDDKNAVIRKSSVTTKESGSYEIDMDYGKYAEWGLPDKVIFSFNTKDYKLPKGLTLEYDKGSKKDQKLKNKKGTVEISYSNYIINKGVDDKEFADK